MLTAAIVPAAGRSERFGSSKLLAEINGEPLLNWTLWSLLDARLSRVIVVVPDGADYSAVRLMKDPRVKPVVNADPSRGMFSSFQTGLSVVSADTFVFLPADMPFVASGTVQEVLQASQQRHRVVVPVHEGRRGHPIAVPGELRRALLMAPAEFTLKDALGHAFEERYEMPVGDPGILRDVDRPEDL
jgi:molybdenum cofactor cytidylyltransferase